MAKNTGSDGRGSSKPILTSKEQDEIRRAAKVRRRPQGQIGTQSSIHNTARLQPETPMSPAEQFRRQQTIKAAEHPAFTTLDTNGIAFELVCETFLVFADIPVSTNCPLGRTKLAINHAVRKLGGRVKDHNDVVLAKHVVYRTLLWAYDELHKPAPAERELQPAY